MLTIHIEGDVEEFTRIFSEANYGCPMARIAEEALRDYMAAQLEKDDVLRRRYIEIRDKRLAARGDNVSPMRRKV